MSGLHLEETYEQGRDAHKGNLLGIQPYMTPDDYASEDTFCAKLQGYLAVAHERGWLTERTIVVWPEALGTWMVCTGERQAVYLAPTMSSGMRTLALGHALRFARHLASAKEKDKATASLLRMKAEAMARLYQAAFSRLAQQHGVTIVAGSTWLPSPYVTSGRLEAGGGPLYNVSAVYGPDGRAYPSLVRKAFLGTAERPFITSAPVAELPAFDTPAGKLGVLICADSWYPAPYERLRALGAELIAVQSFAPGSGIWDRPWEGYKGSAAPGDVDSADVGRLTEGQAWRKYALAGRISQAGAKCGINVFLRGSFWDLVADGGLSTATSGDEVVEVGRAGAALLNLWV